MCMKNFSDEISELVFERYLRLEKQGKPVTNEWTVLAAIIYENKLNNEKQVITLATGTKCVTGKFAKIENAIIDCHAEILCRRAFKRYLIACLSNENEFKERFQENAYALHLFISQLPCGLIDKYLGANKEINETRKLSRKPGRGEKCEKNSCIDKICKWNILGIQGKKLISVTKSVIKFNSIIIGNCGGENDELSEQIFHESLLVKNFNQQQQQQQQQQQKQTQIVDNLMLNDERNFNKRIKINNLFTVNNLPKIFFAKNFNQHNEFTRNEKNRATASSIVYWLENNIEHNEIIVNGFKQGATMKGKNFIKLLLSSINLNNYIEKILNESNEKETDLIDDYKLFWSLLKKTERFSLC